MYIRNRSQPFATVRKSPREAAMTVPMAMVTSAKEITFGCFQHRWASFRVAGVALCNILAFFMTCQKLFCVVRATHS